MSDQASRIAALKRKAADKEVTAPEREALLAKAKELEEKYPEAVKAKPETYGEAQERYAREHPNPFERKPASNLWTPKPGESVFEAMGGYRSGKTHYEYIFLKTQPGTPVQFIINDVDSMVDPSFGWQSDEWG